MKNIFISLFSFAVLTATAFNANAQYGGRNSLRALLGFSSGAVNLGADFEMKQTNTYGLGGYLFFATGDKDANNYQVLALGAFSPIHLLNEDRVDVYLAPGFGLAMIDDSAPGGDDETTFGPSLKIGAEWKVSPTVKVGLQHFTVVNWMNDDAISQAEYTSAAATFAF